MELRFRLVGIPEMRQRSTRTATALADAVARALRVEHELIMAKAKTRTPVDTGALRASGHVKPTATQGRRLVSEGGFGGPAAAYAVYVHENLTARHRVGQAKFYESAFLEAQPGLAARLAASIRANPLDRR